MDGADYPLTLNLRPKFYLVPVLSDRYNGRANHRRRTVGESPAVLMALDSLFSPVAVDVLDVSTGGVGVLVPQSVPLAVGRQVALRLPLKPSGHKLYRMEVRWMKPGDFFVSVGLAFL